MHTSLRLPCSIAYNRVRDPLPLASHFYGCDIMPFHVAPPTSNQVRVLVRPNGAAPRQAWCSHFRRARSPVIMTRIEGVLVPLLNSGRLHAMPVV
jgi:hypothetical protein